MSHPRYVSQDLLHFVGRSAISDDEAFERLVTIMHEGWLFSPEGLSLGERSEDVILSSIDPNQPLSCNKRYLVQMVCFADIPEPALQIHTKKYRSFGLAFSKAFLIAKGARPVQYVPRGTKTQPMARYDEICKDWDDLAEVFEQEVDPFFGGRTHSGPSDSPDEEPPQRRIADWVGDDMFGFMKFFDPTLPEDHEDNYYMEREWRCARNIQFAASDLSRVYVATGYEERLSTEFPRLAGKVTELHAAE